jgi:hypothetical protein
MGEYRVSTAAYAKLLLHAGRHAESACVGLLLGEEAAAGVFSVVDAAPLFHHEAPLAPLAEAACAMADAWSQQRGLTVVGLYYAPADGGSAGLGVFAEKLADKVADNCSRACVLLVDAPQLADESKPGVQVRRLHDAIEGRLGGGLIRSLCVWRQLLLKDVKRGWVRVESRLRLDADAPRVASDGLRRGAAVEVADFEDHLDDVKQDWRNPHVVQLLKLQV